MGGVINFYFKIKKNEIFYLKLRKKNDSQKLMYFVLYF